MKKYVILFLLALAACGNTGDSQMSAGESPAETPQPWKPPVINLPTPALNSAELILGGVRHTLNQNASCQQGGTGIFLRPAGNPTPAIIILRPNFSANGEVFMETDQGWSMMFDETIAGASVNWGTLGCRAWAIGNEPGYFELQVADCPLQNHPIAPTRHSTVTFKLRCSK